MKLLLTAAARSATDIKDKQSNDQKLTNQADSGILQSKYAEVEPFCKRDLQRAEKL